MQKPRHAVAPAQAFTNPWWAWLAMCSSVGPKLQFALPQNPLHFGHHGLPCRTDFIRSPIDPGIRTFLVPFYGVPACSLEHELSRPADARSGVT